MFRTFWIPLSSGDLFRMTMAGCVHFPTHSVRGNTSDDGRTYIWSNNGMKVELSRCETDEFSHVVRIFLTDDDNPNNHLSIVNGLAYVYGLIRLLNLNDQPYPPLAPIVETREGKPYRYQIGKLEEYLDYCATMAHMTPSGHMPMIPDNRPYPFEASAVKPECIVNPLEGMVFVNSFLFPADAASPAVLAIQQMYGQVINQGLVISEHGGAKIVIDDSVIGGTVFHLFVPPAPQVLDRNKIMKFGGFLFQRWGNAVGGVRRREELENVVVSSEYTFSKVNNAAEFWKFVCYMEGFHNEMDIQDPIPVPESFPCLVHRQGFSYGDSLIIIYPDQFEKKERSCK